MAEHVADFAGQERKFLLRYGQLIDLQEACGKVGIGAIYLRLGKHEYFAQDVFEIIRLGLIGGGLDSLEAKRLVMERFDEENLTYLQALAVDILVATFAGVEREDGEASTGDDDLIDHAKILRAFLQAGISPKELREMSYEDFVALSRAGGEEREPEITVEEFDHLVANSIALTK
jgi:hypothetical protein